VHAGVIEPGHFRFQCYDEQILHLEIMLDYHHPSFHNWQGLSIAVRENGISDFPLRNKRFALSCAGQDS
jgi:Ni,Fe-hydrogenase III large subunit